MKMRKWIERGLDRSGAIARLAAVVLACSVAVHATSVPAAAGVAAFTQTDTLTLKDGRVLEGEIVRELNGSVWFKYTIGGIEQTSFFTAEQIESFARDAAKPAVSSEPVRAESRETATKPRRPGVPRGAVLTLEGTVGMQFAAKPLEEAIEMLERELGPAEDGPRVVVLKVNSGGGLLLEIERLHRVIEEEFKPRFRTVAWIESAISAAAMTSHIMEEIYFMPQGNYGACTGYSGALNAMKGRGLEEVLYMMEGVSAKGQHDYQIMRSMQIDEPLSATINQDGTVTWYNSDNGEYLVNPEGMILTFNAQNAAQFKFSKGTASTLDELTRLLGYTEVDWVGRDVPGSLFPVSAAEQHQIDWRDSVTETEARFNEYWAKYQISIANAQAQQDRTRRGMFVGAARRELNIIERACKDHPNIKLLNGIPDEFFEEQRELLRDLMRP